MVTVVTATLPIYYYKEMGVGGLVRLFLIGWSPPPLSLEGPSRSERMVGDGQHNGTRETAPV